MTENDVQPLPLVSAIMGGYPAYILEQHEMYSEGDIGALRAISNSAVGYPLLVVTKTLGELHWRLTDGGR